MPLVRPIYGFLRIPRWFPPEGIVLTGHLVAAAGAFGFAYSAVSAAAAVGAAVAVAGNHLADMVDGTHARSTGQCRNGGELLDHFADPLSFSYWMIGLAVSCDRLDLGLVTVLCIYATAVLTNIKAKIIGEFSLARFGPTEFKALLVGYGLVMSGVVAGALPAFPAEKVALVFLWCLVVVGVVQLIVNLALSVRDVNSSGAAPDTSDWQIASSGDPDPPQEADTDAED